MVARSSAPVVGVDKSSVSSLPFHPADETMTSFTSQFSVSLEDSVAFSRLSGDCNPLHVDVVRARRFRFGSTVTHGIHLFLRSLDTIAARGYLQGQTPMQLSATFNKAIVSGERVTLEATATGARIRLIGVSGSQAFTASLELQPAFASDSAMEDSEFAPARPDELDFPPAVSEGTVPLRLSQSLLGSLFPALAALPDHGWIADLLATTQIIGMRCPGMHSIYSGFRLQRSSAGAASARAMHYRVRGTEQRLQMIRLEVAGASLNGTIEAFFRARPVAQRSLREIAASISPTVFAGHRVLVVGGSRGLGELTAKIAVAGGADVTITYSKGADDAQRVCAEANDLGYRCAMQPLDVLAPSSAAGWAWLPGADFSHVYFFASSLITMNAERWDAALFDKFSRMYVTAFATLVDRILDARTSKRQIVRFLYPSSVFVTQPEAGFAEYAVAKAAGEAMCDQLQARRGAQFSKPRLPRMRTDQTSSVTDIGAADPFPVMLDVVRAFHC